MGAVEGECARDELRDLHVAARAGEVLAQQPLAAPLDRDQHDPARERERLLEAETQPLLGVRPQHQAVHQHVDAMSAARVELELLAEARGPPVDARALEPRLSRRLKLLAIPALAPAGDRGGDHGDGSLALLDQPGRHLVGALRRDRLAAARAVRPAERRKQHAQVVVDLGDGPDRGARVGYGRALLDGDRRAQAGDRLDLGTVHLLQELARPRREALDVAALSLGVERVEGEAALAGARRAR